VTRDLPQPTADQTDQLVRTAMLVPSFDPPNREMAIAVPVEWWQGVELAGVTVMGRPVIRLDGLDKPVLVVSAFETPLGMS